MQLPPLETWGSGRALRFDLIYRAYVKWSEKRFNRTIMRLSRVDAMRTPLTIWKYRFQM